MSITPFGRQSSLQQTDELDDLITAQFEISARAQEILKRRVANVELNQKSLNSRLQVLEGGYKLITINQLDSMLNAGWSEKEKNSYGTSVAKLVRSKGLRPQKVPHPTIPGGVNGYEPEVIVEWCEQEGFPIPEPLRYVV